VEDPTEVQPPGSNFLPIILCMEKLRGCISCTLLDDIPLDLGHSPVVESLVSELSRVCITSSTHIVNC